jgi:DNA (cytosine-5)-methyltransferase 1
MISAIPSNSGKSAWENDRCSECGESNSDRTTATCVTCGAVLDRPIVQLADGSVRLIKGFRTSYARMDPKKPAPTITTASGHVGSDLTIHPTENRLLSPLECALLQTFPIDFEWGTSIETFGLTFLREMIGEAVPPAFTRRHGDVLVKLLSGKQDEDVVDLFAAESDVEVRLAAKNLRRVAMEDSRTDTPESSPSSAKLARLPSNGRG